MIFSGKVPIKKFIVKKRAITRCSVIEREEKRDHELFNYLAITGWDYGGYTCMLPLELISELREEEEVYVIVLHA